MFRPAKQKGKGKVRRYVKNFQGTDTTQAELVLVKFLGGKPHCPLFMRICGLGWNTISLSVACFCMEKRIQQGCMPGVQQVLQTTSLYFCKDNVVLGGGWGGRQVAPATSMVRHPHSQHVRATLYVFWITTRLLFPFPSILKTRLPCIVGCFFHVDEKSNSQNTKLQ